ncbi:hypothetical protein BYI23_E003480 (plasmid) [Burkholderia sp. YI23]|nr:hypothetical protein BYI23_E003480 [Burkholderia sp. YI23]
MCIAQSTPSRGLLILRSASPGCQVIASGLALSITQEIAMFRAGEWVGAGKWANRESHPSAWGRPFLGCVLDPADFRAWANSFEFPESQPDLGQIMSLVIRLKAENKLADRVPVEWNFNNVRIVKWELISKLRTAKEEHALWNAMKLQRIDELNHPRRRKKRPLADFLSDGFTHLVSA